jgi:hypothetical protein
VVKVDILANGRKGQYTTGRQYDFSQILVWHVEGEFVFFRDDARKMGLNKIKKELIILTSFIEMTDREVGQEILYWYDKGRYEWTGK